MGRPSLRGWRRQFAALLLLALQQSGRRRHILSARREGLLRSVVLRRPGNIRRPFHPPALASRISAACSLARMYFNAFASPAHCAIRPCPSNVSGGSAQIRFRASVIVLSCGEAAWNNRRRRAESRVVCGKCVAIRVRSFRGRQNGTQCQSRQPGSWRLSSRRAGALG